MSGLGDPPSLTLLTLNRASVLLSLKEETVCCSCTIFYHFRRHPSHAVSDRVGLCSGQPVQLYRAALRKSFVVIVWRREMFREGTGMTNTVAWLDL